MNARGRLEAYQYELLFQKTRIKCYLCDGTIVEKVIKPDLILLSIIIEFSLIIDSQTGGLTLKKA